MVYQMVVWGLGGRIDVETSENRPSGTPQLGANILDRNTSSPAEEEEAAVVTTFTSKPVPLCSPIQ